MNSVIVQNHRLIFPRKDSRQRSLFPIPYSLFPIFFFLFPLLFWSCDYGELGGADQTDTYFPGEAAFTERMDFLCGVWYSHDPGIGRLDGYRIRKWSDFTAADKAKAQALFPELNVDNLQTCSEKKFPQNNDYVLLFDDTVYGQQDDDSSDTESWGFGFLGLIRAVNIFNGDKNRGAVIIEYFEGTDPAWLSDTQGLAPSENPFFGIYYRVLSPNTVQMANAVDLAAMYAGKHYYTEQKTLDQAVSTFDVENEAEFISWGVVIPQGRE
ncbi:MAG: hypothetical protein LBB72_03835 [Spirochaetaceae bacterium]|nr:hypothetical protein [Spirochaetaceae bacterium]